MDMARISPLLLIILLIFSQAGASSLPAQALAFGSRVAAPAAPAPFGKISPTDTSTNQPLNGVVLRWGTSSPGVIYQYCVRANRSACSVSQWVTVWESTSATLQELSPNTNYYWQVRAVDSAGGGVTVADNNVWWMFNTYPNANLPGPFNKLAPTDGAVDLPVSGVLLTWSASPQAASYQYCVDAVSNDVCDSAWTNTNALSVTLNGLSYNTYYYWQVRAVNAAGSVQADAGAWFALRTVSGAPGSFSKSTPVNFAANQPLALTLSWTASPGAGTSYAYCLSTTPCTAASTWTSAGSSLSAAVIGLQRETTYYWQVRATNASGTIYADAGSVWRFTTLLAPPGDFSKIDPADDATSQPAEVLIRWNPSAGTYVRYEYCFSTTVCGSKSVWEQAGTATSASITGLAYGTTYYWQVRAVNPAGTTYADGGAVWSLSTHASPPQPFFKLSLPNAGTRVATDTTLLWSPSAGADSYLYCVDTASHLAGDTTCSGAWVETTDTQTAHLSLGYNQTYYWQVYAINSLGQLQSDGGSWWSFTTVAEPSTFTKLSPQDGRVNELLRPWLYWWTPSTPGATYEVCVNTTTSCPKNNPWVIVTENAPISTTVPLARNTQYYWQVRTTNGGTTTYANDDTWWSFTTLKNPPSSSSQAFSTNEGTPLSAALTASSNYGKTFLRYGSQPAGTLVLNPDGSFTYNPLPFFSGKVTFQFVVFDGYNPPVGPYTATITVNPVNNAPTLAALANAKIGLGEQVSFWAQATDPDLSYGDQLTYSLDGAPPPGAGIDPNTGFFAWTVPQTQHNGDYTFTVRVTDSAGLSATQTVKITVTGMRLYLSVLRK